MSLSQLLTGAHHGVFRWAGRDDAEGRAERAGWRYLLLDTRDALDRAAFLDCCSDVFDLPRSVVGDWEGLDHGLRSLDLDGPDGLLVVWEGWDSLAEADPDAFDCALEVFRDACVAWHDDEVPGAVLLVGGGPDTDLPEL
jgi:Barstar (barnase inhibitor)